MDKKDKELLEFVNQIADIFKDSDIPISRTIIAIGKRDRYIRQQAKEKERERCATIVEDSVGKSERERERLNLVSFCPFVDAVAKAIREN